ncbi:ADP-ribose pyrophosphatase YjhB (NUDIX family) [Ciceribacter lividus]|uniref:ADP-ribose pyrophosphatase YjhB (NUDIX family) n=1 Tax=Ciceribacter lividus TaxID=1197950 RepID=A0A6I7HS71_9HYPH|nr:NUDIX domain-containing protein [Ciceribacter lividus]RCW28190.1 ADP-ribose pyrophosphatase YjhB (NUDIX family) [Ciceribacter lividus]
MGEDRTIEEKRSAASRLVTRMLHGYFAISRGMTLGVRAACYDDAGRIFLVRHSYVPGWHMPGGGVERRETVLQALSKELREEGNLEMTGPAQLFHVYFNTRVSRRDHVLFYRVNVLQTAPRRPDLEIVESGFFALHDLPRGVTPATQRRLRELSGEVPPDDLW